MANRLQSVEGTGEGNLPAAKPIERIELVHVVERIEKIERFEHYFVFFVFLVLLPVIFWFQFCQSGSAGQQASEALNSKEGGGYGSTLSQVSWCCDSHA